ncbi:hypothetical protein FF36_02351 [Frankia torreyi]|uniref:Uncharacterized protein n=1 Tax=Frankia torreyi TaxID=1856 RepID=A0A0D8BGK3_9ACTN|nr:hypothetical protein FF36_02351 [Frankia torreyi]KQM05432.1 hypothetical protein FF86_1016104 [Frankia sp. CpI1-P]
MRHRVEADAKPRGYRRGAPAGADAGRGPVPMRGAGGFALGERVPAGWGRAQEPTGNPWASSDSVSRMAARCRSAVAVTDR